MVVVVQAGEEERDRDALLRVLVVVAALVDPFRIGRVVVLVVQRQVEERPVHPIAGVAEVLAQPSRPDHVDLVGPAQHLIFRRVVALRT